MMEIIKMKDAFSNRLTVELFNRKPYNTATHTALCYRVSLYNPDGFNYYRVCYETLEEAEKEIKKFSCGTFETIQ